MSRRLTAAFVGMLLLVSSDLAAQDCPELIGFSPAAFVDVAVAGGLAYLGSSAGLVIADVSDPTAPRVVGSVVLGDAVRGIAVSDGYAYLATWRGLRVMDVRRPSSPREAAFLDTVDGVFAVALMGEHAFLANGVGGLRVVDVSAPSMPIEVGFVDTPGFATGVAVEAGHAYVADDYSGLRVIDVSTPSAPVEVGFVDTQSEAVGVAVSAGYAYVADWEDGLRVIDVGVPSEPFEVGFVDTPNYAGGVAVSGGHSYVADGMTGLRVIDVSTPSSPTEVGFLDTPGFAYAVVVTDTMAYVADNDAGLRVIDVSTAAAPAGVGFLGTPGEAMDVAVSGGHAYVAAGGGGLRVVDVSMPSAPVTVGFLGTRGSASGVAVSGGYAYFADGAAGLRVVDVTTPAAPSEVGFIDTPGYALDVVVDGGHAYVAASGAGLRVVDISTPSVPGEVGFLDTTGTAYGVAVSGGYAYVADGDEGLRVIDVSNPSAPVEVGFVDFFGERAVAVAVSGGYAYVAWNIAFDAHSGGLKIVDVRTPLAPVEVGSFGTPGSASDITVSGAHAYITWENFEIGWGGLRVADVSTPSAPVEAGSFLTNAGEGVTIADGQVFLAAGYVGLYILWECAPRDPLVSFISAAAAAAGAEGAFFQTDVEINNTGAEEAQVYFEWLPRGEDNSQPIASNVIPLAPGQSRRYENVLTEVFGLEPDSLGALKLVTSTGSVIGMSRTYNLPAGGGAGTFGQGLPAIRSTDMIMGTEPKRILFLSENADFRANVGCVNGTAEPVRIDIELYDDEGTFLETRAMHLGPYSNDQINRIFRDHAPVNGFVDVSADRGNALYMCYGSLLDNTTSDPTTILPQVPSANTSFILAAALAAGLEGSFFQTDVDLNNVGSTDITYQLLWLPRGADNSDPVHSDTFSLAPGAGVRYANVLDEVFGLEPDQVGALAIEASGIDLMAMSRTYNLAPAEVGGTFGQELPGIPADRMLATGVKKRIIFMSENDDVRANVGCVNGVGTEVAVQVELYDSDGVKLETTYMMLPPFSNRQINGIFQDYAPVDGYVDVRTSTPDASIYCYGSVLDNLTSDPTTVLPQ